jgi:hypothetical protein
MTTKEESELNGCSICMNDETIGLCISPSEPVSRGAGSAIVYVRTDDVMKLKTLDSVKDS